MKRTAATLLVAVLAGSGSPSGSAASAPSGPPAPPGPAASHGGTPASSTRPAEMRPAGTAAYGKAGLVRLIVMTRALSGKPGDAVLVRIQNEGQEDFTLRAEDGWSARARDGRAIALVRRRDPGEKKIPPALVLAPLHASIVVLDAPAGAAPGEIASIDMESRALAKTLSAKEPYEPPAASLLAPPLAPARGAAAGAIGQEETTVAIVVGADGQVESVTPLPEDPAAPPRAGSVDAIRAAVRKWTFTPARQNGTPVRAVLERTFRFSAQEVVRRVFASPASELEPRLARYLKESYPWVVSIPSARGFAVAARPWKKKGIRGADAWLLRVGDAETSRTWVAVTSLTLLVRESPLGSSCECYWWTAQEEGARDFMDLLAARLDLTAVQAEVFAPQDGALIPSGLVEPEALGRWSRAAVRKLLGTSFATILGKNKQRAALSGVLAALDPAQPPPAAAEFLPSPASSGSGADPLRLGDDVTPPVLIRRVSAEYPLEAKNARVQGRVWLEATIDTTGTVTDLEILRGIAGLNVASVDAACCWRYRPATRNGQPVSVYYPVYLDYGLR